MDQTIDVVRVARVLGTSENLFAFLETPDEEAKKYLDTKDKMLNTITNVFSSIINEDKNKNIAAYSFPILWHQVSIGGDGINIAEAVAAPFISLNNFVKHALNV
jgi:hypothetical protein